MRKVLFFFLFYILLLHVSNAIRGYDIPDGGISYQQISGFMGEKEDTLDAVYIGASPTYTSWLAPIAWKKYGIAVRTFANSAQPFVVTENFLRIAKEKQKNAVFIICINGVYKEDYLTVKRLHETVDFFPNTMEKIKLIETLANAFNCGFEDKAELFFPLIRYHSRWTDVSTPLPYYNKYKGAIDKDYFLKDAQDISPWYNSTFEKELPPEYIQAALSSLLTYCKEEKINVVFVLSAQYRVEYEIKWYNAIIEEIEKEGFPIINEMKDWELIGLDDDADFYNELHTNIHGALKITDYLSEYLLENYTFPQKMGGYEEWDKAYNEYKSVITSYLSDEELNRLP